MKTLQIEENKARSIYRTASPELKIMLEDTFGKEFFNQSVVDRLNTWRDMLQETGRPDVPEFNGLPEDLKPFFKALYKNVVMVEAYNEGKTMDIYANEKRHYPYFSVGTSPSSFGFIGSDCGNAAARAGSGSRLSFKSSELSTAAGKKHTDIFKEMLEY